MRDMYGSVWYTDDMHCMRVLPICSEQPDVCKTAPLFSSLHPKNGTKS